MEPSYQKFSLLISSAMLLVALLPFLPYDYYVILRIVVSVSSIMNIYTFNKSGDTKAVVAIALILVIFNPIIPIHLDKVIWAPIDIIVAVYFYGLYRQLIKSDE